MSRVQTARDLVAHQGYVKTNGSPDLTRKSTAQQEWVFGASGGHELMIKFDKNFIKKHLYMYSKKTTEVEARAAHLWVAAGKPPGRDLEFWVQAETEKLSNKLSKATSARCEAKVCRCKHFATKHVCSGCGHDMFNHLNAAGGR